MPAPNERLYAPYQNGDKWTPKQRRGSQALIGYGRVSTEDQNTRSQQEQLTAAGCTLIFEEKASGGDRNRPGLADMLTRTKRGDTLVATRTDRLARLRVPS